VNDYATVYFLLTRRVVRYARHVDARDRYAARYDTSKTWSASGPFRTAARAALAALSTHTCLAAQVFHKDQLAAVADSRGELPGEGLREAARYALGFLSWTVTRQEAR
jgi:hypothetical protein